MKKLIGKLKKEKKIECIWCGKTVIEDEYEIKECVDCWRLYSKISDDLDLVKKMIFHIERHGIN